MVTMYALSSSNILLCLNGVSFCTFFFKYDIIMSKRFILSMYSTSQHQYKSLFTSMVCYIFIDVQCHACMHELQIIVMVVQARQQHFHPLTQ